MKQEVEEAVAVWEAGVSYWTEQREQEYLAIRKSLHLGGGRREESGGRSYNQEWVGEYSAVPATLVDMEKTQARLVSLGNKVNKSLVSALISAQGQAGQADKALETLAWVQEHSDYSLNPSNIDSIINSLLGAGRLEEALAFLERESAEERKVFGSSLVDVMTALVKEDRKEKMLELVSSLQPNKFVGGNSCNITSLMAEVSKEGEEEAKVVMQAFVENGFVSKSDVRPWIGVVSRWLLLRGGPISLLFQVENYLEQDNMAKVMEIVEKVAAQQKRFPAKQVNLSASASTAFLAPALTPCMVTSGRH